MKTINLISCKEKNKPEKTHHKNKVIYFLLSAIFFILLCSHIYLHHYCLEQKNRLKTEETKLKKQHTLNLFISKKTIKLINFEKKINEDFVFLKILNTLPDKLPDGISPEKISYHKNMLSLSGRYLSKNDLSSLRNTLGETLINENEKRNQFILTKSISSQ
ncbi:MAG: hypothetical protein HY939_05180 [Gammaproteobacteria bacterium]|nr:hypothetical protein [Gammaproteobacteria bacterium]